VAISYPSVTIGLALPRCFKQSSAILTTKEMSKPNIAEIAAKVFKLLEPLTPDERQKVITGTLALFGEQPATAKPEKGETLVQTADNTHSGPAASVTSKDAAEFFHLKDPQNKGEELAVAARLREQRNLGTTHTKDDLKQVIAAARRNFDANNFRRDMANAQRRRGFFTMSHGGRGSYTLAYYGQQYIDALPDRAKAKALRGPGRRNRKKSQRSQKS
jgi:hypothetical protein